VARRPHRPKFPRFLLRRRSHLIEGSGFDDQVERQQRAAAIRVFLGQMQDAAAALAKEFEHWEVFVGPGSRKIWAIPRFDTKSDHPVILSNSDAEALKKEMQAVQDVVRHRSMRRSTDGASGWSA
jgi:hypothetical protein